VLIIYLKLRKETFGLLHLDAHFKQSAL